MAVLIVVVLVLAIGGAIAFVVKSKGDAHKAAAAGVGPNEFLKAPPTSFPSTKSTSFPTSTAAPALATGDAAPAALPAGSEPVPAETDADATVEVPVATTPTSEPAVEPTSEPVAVAAEDDEDEGDEDDEIVISRFRAPGARSAGSAEALKPMAAAKPVFHLEDLETKPEPAHAEPEPEPAPAHAEPEPAHAEVAVGSEPAHAEPAVEPELVIDAEPVIDLAKAEAEADEEAWHEVALESEPDAVDHVLQALINRARFKQVGVEEVATELVERADLRGEEASDVLAELVGRADDRAIDEARTSELTLFNDEVPSRPGQLTDFARLPPADKKRIIIRVLCLLVARSEDQQLPPRDETDSTAAPKSWPLARAVWPLAASADDDGDGQLPSRRLAKSG